MRAAGDTAPLTKLGDARSGSLLIKTDDGYADAKPAWDRRRSDRVRAAIRARVTQIFRNPTQNWVEAVYVYPLPEGGAVDTLKMVVGDRIVVGEIKERQQARAIYEQAKQNGQKAALTEQEGRTSSQTRLPTSARARPCWCKSNTRSRCTNGRRVLAPRSDGRGPPLQPGAGRAERRLRPDGSGWVQPRPIRCPTVTGISPPVLESGAEQPGQSDQITVRLQAGLSARRREEPLPYGQCREPRRGTRIIKLANGPVPADRDFESDREACGRTAPQWAVP